MVRVNELAMSSSLSGHHFGCEQVDAQVAFNGNVSQPACQLMDHQRCRKIGGVDSTGRGAGARVGFRRREQRRFVVLVVFRIIRGEHPDDFATHSTVDPQVTTRFHALPDGGP